MNAAILRSYTTTAVVAALLVLSTTVSSQNLNDGSFQTNVGDFDYQDFQQFSPQPTPPSVAIPQRSAARPRSPAIASASGQSKVTPTPVAILKQINRHNEDGSYTYGFEGGDGSFKIETKLATGEVIGKYGYVDDSGKVRTVEYGANKYGFQPAGEGITIPPVNFGNDTDDSFNTDSPPPQAADEGQFFQIPVRPAKPPPAPKRKPAKQPQQVLVDQRVPRPQIPQQPYFVREPEDVQIRPQPQRPAPSAADFNNLQLLLGNELRDLPPFQFRANENAPPQREDPQQFQFRANVNAPQREDPQQFQFRPNEIPPQRAGFQSVAQEEAPEEPIPRPFPQSLTIPSVFNQQPQFAQAQAPEQIDFNQFDLSGVPRASSGGAFRASARGQPKPKSRPQVLFIAQPEDIQQPSAVRRNSNVGPETRSVLDELLKQYAIPNASPSITDFSFSQNAQ